MASQAGASITYQEHDYRGLNCFTEKGLQNTSNDDIGSDSSPNDQRSIDYTDLDALQENRLNHRENFVAIPVRTHSSRQPPIWQLETSLSTLQCTN